MQWFPGHMAKAKREIESNLKLVDIVFELVDARIPRSSRNPLINDILKNKPRLIVITKASMADDFWNKKWLNYFQEQDNAILIDAYNNFNFSKILNAVQTILFDKLAKEKKRGQKSRALRAMVLGIPNVGKSTFINRLVNKKITNVGNKPGVTKAQQWIRINKDLELLDTPGVLWPKFDDLIVGYHLALTGAIKEQIIRKEEIVFYLLTFLKANYPGCLKNNYQIEEEIINTDFIIEMAKRKKFFNHLDYDYEKVYDCIINDFKNAKLGKITLDVIKNELSICI